MTAQTSPVQTLERQRTTPAFRAVRWLIGAYLILSALTVAAIITLSGIAPDLVTPQASVRGIIVAATSVLTFVFASRAAKDSQRAPPPAHRRRSHPHRHRRRAGLPALPLWMIIEQAACGALLAATAIIIFGQGCRTAEKNTPSSGQERPAAS